MARAPITPRLLSVADAGRYIGVSRRTIERYIKAGKLKTRRLPSPDQKGSFMDRTLIAVSELDRLDQEESLEL